MNLSAPYPAELGYSDIIYTSAVSPKKENVRTSVKS
jgi:hypothetical protein